MGKRYLTHNGNIYRAQVKSHLRKMKISDAVWDVFGKNFKLHGVNVVGRTIFAFTSVQNQSPPETFRGYKFVLEIERDPLSSISKGQAV